MSQVDEGLIHAWLDGQLPHDEAARVERLVATDVAWGDAAAEARGMIAGASRILGALDDVPSVKNSRQRDAATASGATASRSWRRAWWLRVAASLVLVVGIGGVVWSRLPEQKPAPLQAPTADVVAPAVVVEPSAAAPAAAQEKRLELRPGQLQGERQKQRAATSVVAGKVGAAPPAAPVVEQGVMGVARAEARRDSAPAEMAAKSMISERAASQVAVDPRLNGCWVPLDSGGRAADRANVVRDADVFVLHFVPPTVTDVVRAAAPAAAPAAARGGVRTSLRGAPAGASVQNATSRALNDSMFATDWVRGNGTTQLTFTVRGDTLRGMAVSGARGVQETPRSFTALRVVCPR